jgi:hypothetical protein
VLRAEGEFEVALALSGDASSLPWRINALTLLVQPVADTVPGRCLHSAAALGPPPSLTRS